jgi:putative membrane protein
MHTPLPDKKEKPIKENASEHLANERTFLAWIRTAIGIMAFGFVVVKFSIFLRRISILMGKDIVDKSHGYSDVIGIIIVATGALTLFLSLLRFQKVKAEIIKDQYHSASGTLIVLVSFIIIISIILITYLITTM